MQTSYKYDTLYGAPGGIVDLAPHEIDTFANEENNGVLKFGMGVVSGTAAADQCKLPGGSSTAATFLGVVTNNRTTELGLDGQLYVRKGAAVGVMRYGRIYARIDTGLTIAYGDKLYMCIASGKYSLFTNSSSNSIEIQGRFLNFVDATNEVAEIELFNQAQVVPG